jgi:hypothetical protein
MVHATRALFAMYAPWFAGSVFCANALEANIEEIIREQARQYAVDAALAYAGFQHYAERKAQALLEGEQGERLLEQSREQERTVSHIQARAVVRGLKQDYTRGRSLVHLLRKLDETGAANGSGDPPENGRAEKPAGRTRPKPAHPAQLSLFD